MSFTWSLNPALAAFLKMHLEPVLMIVSLAVILGVIIHGTRKQTKWGINLKVKDMCCPRCGEKMPFLGIRKPTSLQQSFWGGWTCPKCGCEIDKWGREGEKLNKKERR